MYAHRKTYSRKGTSNPKPCDHDSITIFCCICECVRACFCLIALLKKKNLYLKQNFIIVYTDSTT